MKKIIIILLTIILVFCACLSTKAQIPRQKTLIYPETWIMASGNSQFRVITSNDSISRSVVYLEGIIKFTYLQKEDRHGIYWERSYYFQNKSWNTVVKWVDSLSTKLIIR
jgi:hypothetical protein